MEIMLHEKVNLIDALECIPDITPEIKMVISYIKSGVYLSEAIKKCNFLNECELSIIKTGEKSGEL